MTITMLVTIDSLICKTLVDVASPDELPALMEVIHAGKGRQRVYQLRRLNTEFKKTPWQPKKMQRLKRWECFQKKCIKTGAAAETKEN